MELEAHYGFTAATTSALCINMLMGGVDLNGANDPQLEWVIWGKLWRVWPVLALGHYFRQQTGMQGSKRLCESVDQSARGHISYGS